MKNVKKNWLLHDFLMGLLFFFGGIVSIKLWGLSFEQWLPNPGCLMISSQHQPIYWGFLLEFPIKTKQCLWDGLGVLFLL